MAVTSVPTGLTPKQWDAKYFKEYLNKNWIKQFASTGSNGVIQMKDALTKKPGDTVNFTLVNRLTGTAIDETGTLEGNEEALKLRSMPLTIREYSHAVRWERWGEQLSAIPLRKAHKDALMDWNMELDRDNLIRALGSINGTAYGSASEANKDIWAVDNEDRLLFGNVKGNHSGDHSADLAKVDNTADKLTASSLSLMKRMAKTANPKIRPIKPRDGVSGSDMYALFAPSLLVRDLANDSAFQQANREARARGKSNPIFKGADYIYENIAVYEVEDIATLSGVGAGGIDVAPCYLLGAQALGMAWGMRPKTIADKFDYDREYGVSVQQYYEIDKLRFGSGSADTDDLKDHGVLTGYFAAVADA